MDELIVLLQTIVDRTAWPSETSHQAALAQLRKIESAVGASGIVGPVVGTWEDEDGNSRAPAERPRPGVATAPVYVAPSAQDITAAAQALVAAGWTPPSSPEIMTSPETDNVFASTTPPTTPPAGDAGP